MHVCMKCVLVLIGAQKLLNGAAEHCLVQRYRMHDATEHMLLLLLLFVVCRCTGIARRQQLLRSGSPDSLKNALHSRAVNGSQQWSSHLTILIGIMHFEWLFYTMFIHDHYKVRTFRQSLGRIH